MSAFIVSENTMHRIVGAILNVPHPDFFAGINKAQEDAGTQIGQKLYGLNTEAVNYRYNETDAPPEYAFSRPPFLRARPVQVLKSLRCLLYQCDEGNCPETPLYQELDAFSHRLALEIIRQMPEWETADWD